MKKLYYLIILTVILGLVLTGCLLSNVGQVPATEQSGITYLTKHTENAPFEVTLFAGQTIDVGTVSVWNDDEKLYVKYETAGDWYLTETHLHVACSESDIPQNKKGNPTPGKFMHNEEHDYLTEYSLPPILLSSIGCDTPVIAAHAVVQKLSDVMTVTLVSDTQTFSAGYTETEPVGPLDPANYNVLGTWSAAVPVSSPPWSVVLPGAIWVSSADTTEGGDGDQWRLFKEAFEIPLGAVITSASLTMTADNAVEAYLNSTLVGTTGDVYGTAPYPQLYNFDKLWGPYTLTPQVGLNTIMFVVRNWVHTDNNPTGLIYKLDYEYQLFLEEETAWAAGERFTPKGNWATYFAYTVQAVPVDTTWILTFEHEGEYYPHDMVLTNTGGFLTGSGGYPVAASPYEYPWTITSGTISGDVIDFFAVYHDCAVAGAIMHLTGIITTPGIIMDGEWTDNAWDQDRSGTWTAALVP